MRTRIMFKLKSVVFGLLLVLSASAQGSTLAECEHAKQAPKIREFERALGDAKRQAEDVSTAAKLVRDRSCTNPMKSLGVRTTHYGNLVSPRLERLRRMTDEISKKANALQEPLKKLKYEKCGQEIKRKSEEATKAFQDQKAKGEETKRVCLLAQGS